MSSPQETITVGGVKLEIPPEERTPLVDQLLRMILQQQQEIEQLRDEIRRLKGLPEPPKRPPQASTLNDPQGKPSRKNKKRKRKKGKRPGSQKRKKDLKIDETVKLELADLPEGSKLHGYEDFLVQDLVIEPHNTRYRRARYKLADGSWTTAPLPPLVSSHFGPGLRSYVLYQHHQNHVTQPLLLEELREFGVDISAGQIDRLLTEGHDAFHQEKDALLPTAREVSQYLQTDDTSARHQGRNGHTLHIGNDWFATFFTSDTKSRVNFLEVLREPFDDYVVGGDALFYMEMHDLPKYLLQRIGGELEVNEYWELIGQEAWRKQLAAWKITSEGHRRIVTEGALFGSLMIHDLCGPALISDDAKQFKILGFMHGLCWVHCERHVAGLIPLNERERKAYDRVRDEIWQYYQRLKAYRDSPTARRKTRLERDFDRLFLQRTGYPALNEALQKIHGKREQLLLVLDHPEIPLHNNLSENDIRQYVKKRKISGGTRSELGRRCRDTFLSLKTTCRKLGLTFWSYLRDRINGVHEIPPIHELLRQAATAKN
jgi:hypothetical protein